MLQQSAPFSPTPLLLPEPAGGGLRVAAPRPAEVRPRRPAVWGALPQAASSHCQSQDHPRWDNTAELPLTPVGFLVITWHCLWGQRRQKMPSAKWS